MADTVAGGGTSVTPTIDYYTAEVLDPAARRIGFMAFMLRLHTDMFAGLPGKLFLGLMALLLLVAIVSGVVLYAPFVRRLQFGDYGGVPMKILWAALDIITIILLGSGLYLWLARRRTSPASKDQVTKASA